MNFFRENKRGFLPEDAPKTRLQLFKLIIKDYLFTIVGINFVLLAIFSLSLFWGITGIYYIYIQYIESGMNIMDTLPLFGTFTLIMIPCLLITGPFMGGISLVLRNLSRDDARDIKEYFKLGIISSWKQSLILSFINSVIPALMYSAFSYYAPLVKIQKFYVFPLTITIMICLIILIILPTAHIMTVTYELGLFQQIKNATVLSLTNLPAVILVNLLTIAPIILLGLSALIGGKVFVVISFIVFVYYFFIGFAISALMKASLANKLCEENLNKILGINTHIGMKP